MSKHNITVFINNLTSLVYGFKILIFFELQRDAPRHGGNLPQNDIYSSQMK